VETISTAPDKASLPRTHFTWRLARGLLLGGAALATLVAGLYTEENWRGRRAWEACRQELELKGAVFDWSTRVPPPVPDDQNFFSAPNMAEWFAGKRTNDLSRRLDDPRTHSVSFNESNTIRTEADARDYLEWSDQFSPDFDEIRSALKRPFARIECDYGRPTTVIAPNFFTIRSLAQTLAQRAHSFFLLHEPQKALQELTLLHDFCRILESPPTGKPITLVGAMINVAVTGLYVETIAEGLHLHAWQEPQLIALEHQLSEIHLEKSIAETLVDEPMFTLRTLETSSRQELVNLFEGSRAPLNIKTLLLQYAPRGWLYQNMVVHARLNEQFSDGFNAFNQTVAPRKIDGAGQILYRTVEHVSPYSFYTSWVTPNWVRALQKFALNQTMANQGAVACALERYRLLHDEFPETLHALVPRFINKVPHDITGGQPLHYRRIDAGQFLLYSIGWNESDDDGVPGEKIEDGDWVFGAPPAR
jgi:hypothetical protein